MKKIILLMTLLFVILWSFSASAAEAENDKAQWEYVTTSKDVDFYVDINSNHVTLPSDNTISFYMIRSSDNENTFFIDKLILDSTNLKYCIEKSATFNLKTKERIALNLKTSEWNFIKKDSPIYKGMGVLIEALDKKKN